MPTNVSAFFLPVTANNASLLISGYILLQLMISTVGQAKRQSFM